MAYAFIGGLADLTLMNTKTFMILPYCGFILTQLALKEFTDNHPNLCVNITDSISAISDGIYLRCMIARF